MVRVILGVLLMAATVNAEVEFTDACGRELRIEASVRAYEGEAYVESIDSVEVHDGTTWVEVHDYVDSEVHDAVLERIDDPWALTAECLDIECSWAAEAQGDAAREEGW